MDWGDILVIVFGSGAVISVIGEIILYMIKRNDTKKDETLAEIKHLKQAQKVLMRAEIVKMCKAVLINGEIAFDESQDFADDLGALLDDVLGSMNAETTIDGE